MSLVAGDGVNYLSRSYIYWPSKAQSFAKDGRLYLFIVTAAAAAAQRRFFVVCNDLKMISKHSISRRLKLNVYFMVISHHSFHFLS